MANSEPRDQEPIRFCKPFDEEDADLIIRSSDNVHFRVHKLILRKASPVFGDMFTLPSPGTGVQTVSLAEDGDTVSRLLHLFYPFGAIGINDLKTASMLVDVCDKYQVHALADRLGLIKLVDTDPVRIYVLACRAHDWDAARRAAFGCLALPLEQIIDSDGGGQRHLPTPLYRSLLVYYSQCRRIAAHVLSGHDYPWLSEVAANDFCWFTGEAVHDACCLLSTTWYSYGSKSSPRCPHTMTRRVSATTTVSGRYPKQWWHDAMAPIEAFLAYQAPPLQLCLAKNAPFVKPVNIPCNACKTRSAEDIFRFFIILEAEILKRVKGVKFEFVG
ncbi:hypothetical protein BC629DRAFT_219556 [Irpex lacteus]|nr:hypothetical protein BC629DRAFT_219556 [Irpex lacteus]